MVFLLGTGMHGRYAAACNTLGRFSDDFSSLTGHSAGLRRSRHVGAHVHVAHCSRSVCSPACGKRLAQGRLLQVQAESERVLGFCRRMLFSTGTFHSRVAGARLQANSENGLGTGTALYLVDQGLNCSVEMA